MSSIDNIGKSNLGSEIPIFKSIIITNSIIVLSADNKAVIIDGKGISCGNKDQMSKTIKERIKK